MQYISIKTQIILLVVSSLLILSFVTTFIAVNKSEEALLSYSYSALTTARDIKKIRL